MKTSARIGPNAVTQLAAALDAQAPMRKEDIFTRAGVRDWLITPPQDMVDENKVAQLHQTLRQNLPAAEAHQILAEAGRRTANYILRHRIPSLFRHLLPLLPAQLSARLLTKAITRHAWTFAGTGGFAAQQSAALIVSISDNPLCRGEHSADPVCHWHAAVFTRLFGCLAHEQARTVEFSCCAAGDDACRFVIDWPRTSIWIQIKARLASLLAISPQKIFQPPDPKDQTRAP